MSDNTSAARLMETEIDQIVEAQANDNSAWENPVFVQRNFAALALPSQIAQKAAYFASLHKEVNSEIWLLRIIQERLDLEEAALNQIKVHLTNGSK